MDRAIKGHDLDMIRQFAASEAVRCSLAKMQGIGDSFA